MTGRPIDGLMQLYFQGQYNLQRLTQSWRYQKVLAQERAWPILIGLSFPKSGTNLLRQVLSGFGQVYPFVDRSYDVFAAFKAQTGEQRTAQDALRFLATLRSRDIAAAHFLAWPEVVAEICSPEYVPYFIYRDPRDVVVSHVFYVTTMATDHAHHAYYTKKLHSFDERLTASIRGLQEAGEDLPDIATRYQPYLGWIDQPAVLPLRFEDFILDRQVALQKVIGHFSKKVDLEATPELLLSVLEASINPQKSPTYRSGKVGEWRKHFSEENKALFKEIAGDLLVRLGYETGHEW